jgi:hypothetical protein
MGKTSYVGGLFFASTKQPPEGGFFVEIYEEVFL